MELKDFQVRTLKDLGSYLETLSRWKQKSDDVFQKTGVTVDFPLEAWREAVKKPYFPHRDGLDRPLPVFCLKIPTGGGKTFLAVKAIDRINATYRRRQTGLVLWIVPTTQIYRQTIARLRDRDHPYRQHLDVASGGRTMIVEKTDRFTPLDVAENLVVLMLMLPSAARQTKDALKVFKDSGAFLGFFPLDDDPLGHQQLLARFPNLDTFESGGLSGRQVKTSLGNTLRLLSPLIILDEGQRAYSDLAQQTIRGFNPCIVVELSATPPEEANVLVDIKGVELEQAGMIKLDLHVTNKATADWKVAMLAAKEKRDALEADARVFESQSGRHIRPICLIQAERVGKDQRGRGFIHADDVKDYLIKTCGIQEAEVAVKTSERDDIEGIDLLSRDCEIRYIITKSALQEGWDCPFAYVLAILTNPGSKNSLTQLVGRILRQPGAKKTRVRSLDESYVYCFRQKAEGLLESIKRGFAGEGLGDLQGRVSGGGEGEPGEPAERSVPMREKFKSFADRVYLPVFVIKDGPSWRKVVYESDVVSRIDWAKADFRPVGSLSLERRERTDTKMDIALNKDESEVIRQRNVQRAKGDGIAADAAFVARQLADAIPNPWVAFEIADRVVESLSQVYGAEVVGRNLVFIIDELKKRAESEKDRLAEKVFRDLIRRKIVRFMMFRDGPGYRLPGSIRVKKNDRTLTRCDGSQLELSLYPFVAESGLNQPERAVAWYLDEQARLVWWYRNIARQDYSVQGWRKGRIYPDFIAADGNGSKRRHPASVYVVETKGTHLKNEDTDYKKSVFALCNELAEEKSWTELGLEFPGQKIRFEVVFEEQWQARLNEMLSKSR